MSAEHLAEAIEKAIDRKVALSKAGAATLPAEFVGKDGEGKPWVMLPGASFATPVGRMSVEAAPGDTVAVTVSGGTASVDSNISNPSAGVAHVQKVEMTADAAKSDAARAVAYSVQARAASDEAKESAEKAFRDALSASASASQAVSDAKTARAGAESATAYAARASSAASSAQESAESAQESATEANSYAVGALRGLSDVEKVVGTVQWIAEHGTYSKTADTTVVVGKQYYVKQNESYVAVSDPVDADIGNYYELDVSGSVQHYIASHLAQTDYGLDLMVDGTDLRMHLGTVDGTKPIGTYVVDGTGRTAAFFGETSRMGRVTSMHTDVGNGFMEVWRNLSERVFSVGTSGTELAPREEAVWSGHVWFPRSSYHYRDQQSGWPLEYGQHIQACFVDELSESLKIDLRDPSGFMSKIEGVWNDGLAPYQPPLFADTGGWHAYVGFGTQTVYDEVRGMDVNVNVLNEHPGNDDWGCIVVSLLGTGGSGLVPLSRRVFSSMVEYGEVDMQDTDEDYFYFLEGYTDGDVAGVAICGCCEPGHEPYFAHVLDSLNLLAFPYILDNAVREYSADVNLTKTVYDPVSVDQPHVDFGGNALSYGDWSAGFGEGVVHAHDNQFAAGRFNANADNAFEVGNGTDKNNRSNALALGWNGDLSVAGDMADGAGHVLSEKADAADMQPIQAACTADTAWLSNADATRFFAVRAGNTGYLRGTGVKLAQSLPVNTNCTVGTLPSNFIPYVPAQGLCCAFGSLGTIVGTCSVDTEGNVILRNLSGTAVASGTNLYLSTTYIIA